MSHFARSVFACSHAEPAWVLPTAAATATAVVVAASFYLLRRWRGGATDRAGLQHFSDDSEECKMVILVRTDLNMGKGKAAAQCCHAVLAAYKTACRRYPRVVEAWEHSGQPKVTLRVDSEAELNELCRKACEAGVVAETIRDAGRTQLVSGTKSVCAIGPGPSKMINLLTGHLNLY